MKYPLPSLTAVQEGAHVDARFKIALAILASPNFVNDMLARHDDSPAISEHIGPTDFIADVAISLAEKVYEQAGAKGWITELDDDPGLPPAEQAHVKRNAGAQVLGQAHAQTVAAELQSRVQPARGIFPANN